MSKISIAIIAKNYWSGDFLKKQLDELFDGLFDFTTHSPDTNPVLPVYNADLILLHEPSCLNDMYEYIKCDCPTILLRRTINKEALARLKELPKGSTAVVVNLNDYMAQETLINIYNLGIKNIKMSHWSPERGEFPDVDYVITPRIYTFLPETKAEVIKLGSRVLHIDIVVDILSYFNIDMNTVEKILRRHMALTPTFLNGVKYILENNKYLSLQLDVMFDKINKSIAVIDSRNYINYVNKNFLKILNIKEKAILNQPLTTLSKFIPDLKELDPDSDITNEFVKIDNKSIILNTKNMYNDNRYIGKIIILESYDVIRYIHQKHHASTTKNKHAKYIFDNLIGNSPIFIDAINLCKKFANASSPILIHGESGTGKELVANSIHNYSLRKSKPFIAVNCASIPKNLFEAEFFGYEEGSFTGALKGGKPGFFEKANGGTIFLDEISEIPLELQSRLLRVLQEGEVRRVGSNYNIKVDLKVISSSNRDLYAMVKENKFRLDLYYRLNVFPIKLPSLTERGDDILLITNEFLKRHPLKSTSKFFDKFLLNYDWPGNIRELKNVIEFAATIADEKICIEHLPRYIIDIIDLSKLKYDKNLSFSDVLVLHMIYNLEKENLSTSRKKLCSYYKRKYHEISEVNLRQILYKLEELEYINIPKGPSGPSICEKGIAFLDCFN